MDDRGPESPARRRRPARVGDLLPEAARALGLEDELRLARAITTWDAIIAERVPPAVGSRRDQTPVAKSWIHVSSVKPQLLLQHLPTLSGRDD